MGRRERLAQRRRVSVLGRGMAILVGATLAATACQDDVALDEGPVELTIAEPGEFTGAAPLYIAVDAGYFEERGINIDIVTLSAGQGHVDAVLTGEAWAFFGGLEHILFANARGADLRALTSLEDRPAYYLVGRPDHEPPEDLGDALRGATITATGAGGTPNTVLRWALLTMGLDPATDVDLLEGSVDTILGSMASGEADYALVFDPLLDFGLVEGHWGEPLTDWPAEVGPIGNTVIGIQAEIAEEQGDIVERFLDALAEARQLMWDDPERAEEILQARFELPEGLLSSVLDRAYEGEFFSRDGAITEAALARSAELVRTVGLYDDDYIFEEIVLTQYQP